MVSLIQQSLREWRTSPKNLLVKVKDIADDLFFNSVVAKEKYFENSVDL